MSGIKSTVSMVEVVRRTRLHRVLKANIRSLGFISVQWEAIVVSNEKGVGMRLPPPRGVCKCVRASRGELYIRYFRSVSTDISSTHIDSLEELKD